MEVEIFKMTNPKPKCKDCLYYKHIYSDTGWCYRYPPSVYSNGEGDFRSTLPVTESKDWCGEFKKSINEESVIDDKS